MVGGDGLIKLWNQKDEEMFENIFIFAGHNDIIKDILILNNTFFMSAAESTVILWKII